MREPQGGVLPAFSFTVRPDTSRKDPFQARVAIAQGAYFLVTGIWPLLHMRSFEWVSGPKTDNWLVRTVSLLITAIGAVLVLAGGRRRVEPEVQLLAVSSSIALGGVSAYYPARGRISRVYWLDALAEAGIIGLWLFAFMRNRRGSPQSNSVA